MEPNIYDYFDYRQFLKDRFSYEKSINRKFTHRFIIESIGASSSGWVSDLLNGRLNLSALFRFKLSELLSLSVLEDEYFGNLISYEHAASCEEKKVFFKRIIGNKHPEAQIILEHQFDFYRIWYVSAIRELLLDFECLDKDYTKIAELLEPQITLEEAEYAIEILLENNLIEKKNEKLLPTSKHIKKDPHFSAFYWKTYMESVLSLSQKAIDYNKEIRDLSSITFNLSNSNFVEAKLLLSDLRKKLLHLSDSNSTESPKKVYQCNLQLIPLTKEF